MRERRPLRRVPRAESGFGKRDASDVASACMIAGSAGLARMIVAELLGCPIAELECTATEVIS